MLRFMKSNISALYGKFLPVLVFLFKTICRYSTALNGTWSLDSGTNSGLWNKLQTATLFVLINWQHKDTNCITWTG